MAVFAQVLAVLLPLLRFFSLLFHNTAALGIPQASSQGELMHLDIAENINMPN